MLRELFRNTSNKVSAGNSGHFTVNAFVFFAHKKFNTNIYGKVILYSMNPESFIEIHSFIVKLQATIQLRVNSGVAQNSGHFKLPSF